MASTKAAKEKYEKWLQLEFTADLAERLVEDAKSPVARYKQAKVIRECFDKQVFEKRITIPDLYWGEKAVSFTHLTLPTKRIV